MRSNIVGDGLLVLVRCTVGILGRLHWRASRCLAGWAASVWWMCGLDGRKEVGMDNIRQAFPSLSKSEARRLLRASVKSFCCSLADALQFRRKAMEGGWHDLVELHGKELLQGEHKRQGVILATAHLGCWEAAGLAVCHLGLPLTSVARGLPYRQLDEYVRQLRETGGQNVVDKKGAMRELIAALRHGCHVGLLIDQDARRDGIFVDFMGRPSSVHTSIARLSISRGCPVGFVYGRSQGRPPHLNIKITDVVWPRIDADKEEEIFRITQRLIKEAERVIRQHPDEWLWIQKQWKTYPGKFTTGKRPMPGVLKDQ